VASLRVVASLSVATTLRGVARCRLATALSISIAKSNRCRHKVLFLQFGEEMELETQRIAICSCSTKKCQNTLLMALFERFIFSQLNLFAIFTDPEN
jgi:hypothetical protein